MLQSESFLLFLGHEAHAGDSVIKSLSIPNLLAAYAF